MVAVPQQFLIYHQEICEAYLCRTKLQLSYTFSEQSHCLDHTIHRNQRLPCCHHWSRLSATSSWTHLPLSHSGHWWPLWKKPRLDTILDVYLLHNWSKEKLHCWLRRNQLRASLQVNVNVQSFYLPQSKQYWLNWSVSNFANTFYWRVILLWTVSEG